MLLNPYRFGSSDAETAGYWIANLGGALADTSGAYRSVGVDPGGNIYVAGQTASSGAGGSDLVVAKYNHAGTLQWQRVLGGTSDDYARGIAVDESGNIYIAGAAASIGSGGFDLLVAKYNTSGALQWQRILGGASADYGYGVALSGSGVYVSGESSSQGSGANDILVVKYDSNGALQWQRVLGGAASEVGYGCAASASDELYVAGSSGSSGSINAVLAKVAANGSFTWARELAGAGVDFAYGASIDSSGNIYVAGTTDTSGGSGYNALLAKFDSSGVLLWQRTLGGSGGDYFQQPFVHGSSVYVIGRSDSQGSGLADLLIARYTSTGTLEWQRVLGGTAFDGGVGLAIDSSGAMVISGTSASSGQGGNDLLIARLPGDGSKTGVYGAYTYAASTLTGSTSSLPAQSPSLVANNATLTSGAGSLTEAAGSLATAKIMVS